MSDGISRAMNPEGNHPKNRLADAASPYLRQHAGNPVDWYPWSDEAFERARAEDKPVFLSVGYSACHWCHVMAHESFEHAGIAEQLNRDFICIKVDREERPDIDALYMTATQLVTQRGGWPNSVWLTPDRRPWYAGTYFPPEDRPGRMGFASLLAHLNRLWRERRADVEKQADSLTGAIRNHHENEPRAWREADAAGDIGDLAREHFFQQFDPRYGGFGDAPKFPPHAGLLLLLRQLERRPDPELATIITRTLDAMMRGGIHDHIGGGFHRYATDERWLLPHFEKMLYDNALLLLVYARAFRRFGFPAYRRIVMETADWLAREMTDPSGGFYAALDADSEGEEGKYYTWTAGEWCDAVGADKAEAVGRAYRIRPGGNYHDEATGRATGRNIPHLDDTIDEAEVAALEPDRVALRAARDQRVRPGRDDKIIAGWNGLTIAALASASVCLNEPRLLAMALTARAGIENTLRAPNRWHRTWCRGQRQEAPAFLDDIAAIAWADLELLAATGDPVHARHAIEGARTIVEDFANPATGELFMCGRDHESMLVRLHDVFDQGSPSGVGLAVQVLVRAGGLPEMESLRNTAQAVMQRYRGLMQRMPSATATLCEARLMLEPSTHTTDIASFGTPCWAPDANGQLRLSIDLQLPPGWRLNPVSTGSTGATALVAVVDETTGRNIASDVHEITESAWRVQVAPGAGLRYTLIWQACTASECRPSEQRTYTWPERPAKQ